MLRLAGIITMDRRADMMVWGCARFRARRHQWKSDGDGITPGRAVVKPLGCRRFGGIHLTESAKPLQSAGCQELDGEGDAVDEITLGEPLWFLAESVEPFEAESLDPERSAFDFAGDEAEADANPHPPHVGKICSQLINELFLFGRPEGHVDHVGSRVLEEMANRIELRRILFETELWKIGSRDLQSGNAFLQDSGGLFGDTGVATHEEERLAICGESSR